MAKNSYEWSNKEKLIEELKLSYGIADFLDKQGLVASSGNYDTFKKWMKVHNMNKNDYFILQKKEKPINTPKEKKEFTIDDVLCIDSIYTRKDANKMIIRDNLLPYICGGCDNGKIWQGKSLTLQLEHKNGDSTDHRLENLEYLCPNCHSQTQTYGSKNKHNRVFKERIKDLIVFNNIGFKEAKEICQKWNIDLSSFRSWVNLYKEKILLIKNINFNWEDNPHNIYYEEIRKNRLLDLIKMENNKNWRKELVILWDLTDNGVKKWIKSNNVNFFNNKYVLSNTYKAKLAKEQFRKQIEIIIKDKSLNKILLLEKVLPLFSMNKASCMSYINHYFKKEYDYFDPIPNCRKCGSMQIQRFGIVKLKKGNKQRYKCYNCSEQFY